MQQPRTYGTLVWRPPDAGARNGTWAMRAEPHVMIKLRRTFPRIAVDRGGIATLADTLEVARDLEWFTSRYPLQTRPLDAVRLTAGADKHRATAEAVQDILGGKRSEHAWREPTRPARDYQRAAAEIVWATGRLLLLDVVGLGKTFTGALTLCNPDALPALVVVPTHLPKRWTDELTWSFPWLTWHVIKTGAVYEPAQRREFGGVEPDVLVISYSKLNKWRHHLAGRSRTVIFDEVQELRKGTESFKGVAAAQIAGKADYRLGLTATPVYNYGGELWNLMDVLAPDVLGTRGEFTREWSGGTVGRDNVTVADPRALGTYLRDQGVLLRRTRKEVGRELPAKMPITQPVDTDHKVLDQLTGEAIDMAQLLLSPASTGKERWAAAGDFDWKMRQATGIAKAPFVAEFVNLLLESEQRVVLWGWHRAVYDIWLERLAKHRPVLYTGSETGAGKQRSVDEFLTGWSRVLIMSLRSGSGVDGLQEKCSVGVFGELDWSPGVHEQCEGRLWRDGLTAPPLFYYLVSEGGTDPEMAEVLTAKRQQSEPIVDPDAALVTQVPDNRERVRRIAEDLLRRRGVELPAAPADGVAS